MLVPRVIALATVAATLSSLAACSGSSDSTTALRQAMSAVAGKGPASQGFEYGDIRRMRQLGLITSATGSRPRILPAWNRVVGWGMSELVPQAFVLPKVTGLELFGADTAVTVGTPPHRVTKLVGSFDRTAITKKLRALGGKPRSFGDLTGISLAADDRLPQIPALTRLGIVTQLDQVGFADDGVVTSPDSQTIRTVYGGGTSLADTGKYGQLADCLGDVIAADIVPAADQDDNVAIYAVGVRDPASKTGPDKEVVCILPRAGEAQKVVSALKQHLAGSARDARTNEPMSRYVSTSAVTRDADVVQAVLNVNVRRVGAGFVFEVLETDGLRLWTE